jgi:MoaA/NifB/PqqE/SkfB family radical SAM enzyme
VATTPAHLGVLQIEPTDHCNLACRMCAPHAERWETVHGVPKGHLDPGLYRRIVDGLVADDCRFDHVIFQWLGDPSAHDGLEDMVDYAGERLAGRVGYLRFDTNGLLLGPERMARVAVRRAVPLLVVFTLDAATPETYRRVKGRDGLERARRNVRRLLALRRHAPVNVQVQFVVQPGNSH